MRSDREHCASRIAVEQEEEERRGGEEQATDIKSNNPHLAGGEKGPVNADRCCVKTANLIFAQRTPLLELGTHFLGSSRVRKDESARNAFS